MSYTLFDKIRRHWILCWGTVVFIIFCFFSSFYFAKDFLFIENKIDNADAVIVLGGESGDRAFRALEVFKAISPKYLIVSGTGDCFLIRDRLLLAGVPKGKLLVEEYSKNTRENALFSIELLRRYQCKKVVIVTSWFHSRRALACFKKYGQGISFFSMPAYHGIDMKDKPSLNEVFSIFREYCALGEYYVRNGISPF